jgi:hypothetical protein
MPYASRWREDGTLVQFGGDSVTLVTPWVRRSSTISGTSGASRGRRRNKLRPNLILREQSNPQHQNIKSDITRTEQAAAPEYDGVPYGCLSLRANQRLQIRSGEHRHRRRAIRVFDRRRSETADSVHNPNDSGAPFKRRPLSPFTDQVRQETGQRAAGTWGGSSSRVA